AEDERAFQPKAREIGEVGEKRPGEGAEDGAVEALDCFFGTYCLVKFSLTEEASDEVAACVAEPGQHEREQHEPGAVVAEIATQERDEPERCADVDRYGSARHDAKRGGRDLAE